MTFVSVISCTLHAPKKKLFRLNRFNILDCRGLVMKLLPEDFWDMKSVIFHETCLKNLHLNSTVKTAARKNPGNIYISIPLDCHVDKDFIIQCRKIGFALSLSCKVTQGSVHAFLCFPMTIIFKIYRQCLYVFINFINS